MALHFAGAKAASVIAKGKNRKCRETGESRGREALSKMLIHRERGFDAFEVNQLNLLRQLDTGSSRFDSAPWTGDVHGIDREFGELRHRPIAAANLSRNYYRAQYGIQKPQYGWPSFRWTQYGPTCWLGLLQ